MSDSAPDPFAFEPVPSTSTRHDGWTAARQRDFIAQLARIGIVSAAAKAVGMSPKSAYRLRDRAEGLGGPAGAFARAWDTAVQVGRGSACATVIDRAIEGVEVPVFYRGLQRGTRRIYDNRLLLAAVRLSDRDAARAERTVGRTSSRTGSDLHDFRPPGRRRAP